MAFFQLNVSGDDSTLSSAVSLDSDTGVTDFFVFNGTQTVVDMVLNITDTDTAATFDDPYQYSNNRRVDHNVAGSAERSNGNRQMSIRKLQPNDTFWATYTAGTEVSEILAASTCRSSHSTGVAENQRVYVVVN